MQYNWINAPVWYCVLEILQEPLRCQLIIADSTIRLIYIEKH